MRASHRSLQHTLIAVLLLFGVRTASAQQIVEDIGHYAQLGLPIAAAGISIIKNDKQGVVQLAKTVVVESVLVYSLKQVIDRERPNGGRFAFPSGHTALSFTSATYLYKRYGWRYGVPATVVASFVGYSRYGIDEPVHYFSDVAAGAAIGIITSLLLTSRYENIPKVTIGGGWGAGSAALHCTLTF